MQTRFRSKRQLWTYSGLGVETRDSAQYRYVRGQLQRTKKPQQIRVPRGVGENVRRGGAGSGGVEGQMVA